MRRISSFTIQVIGIIALGAAVFFLFRPDRIVKGTAVLTTLDPDSDQNLEFAASLAGISVPRVGLISIFTPGVLTRTPGYPLVLAFGLLCSHHLAASILCAHLMLWVCACLFIMRACREACSQLTAFASVALSSLLIQPYVFAVLSEWAFFNFLLMYFASLILLFRFRGAFHYCCNAFIVSLTALTRPEFLPFALISVWILCSDRKRTWGKGGAIALGFAPLFIWTWVNFVNTGFITFSVLSGSSMFTSSVLGTLDPATISEAPIRALVLEAQKDIQVADNKDFVQLALGNGDPLLDKFHHNYDAAERAFGDPIAGWISFSDLLRQYSFLLIKANLLRYFIYVCCGLATLIASVPLLWLTLRFARRFRNSPTFSPIAAAASIVVFVHFFRIGALSMIGIVHTRYYVPSFAAALAGFLILLSIELRNSPPVHKKTE